MYKGHVLYVFDAYISHFMVLFVLYMFHVKQYKRILNVIHETYSNLHICPYKVGLWGWEWEGSVLPAKVSL